MEEKEKISQQEAYLYNDKKVEASVHYGDKSSFVDIKLDDVNSVEKDSNLKERLCCIELINNNRIYLKYELRWKIEDLIKNIVNHPEFKK